MIKMSGDNFCRSCSIEWQTWYGKLRSDFYCSHSYSRFNRGGANRIGIVHCWSRSRRDSSSLWAAARLFKTTWFCEWKTTVDCTLKATHSPGMRCSSSYWKAKPTRWTLLRGISHLWQRQPAFCSTIFTCSPAKQQLCRYQITKDISYGAEPPDVHLFLFFVACFRFPCSFSVL